MNAQLPLDIAEGVLNHMRQSNYEGADPFDGLNSKFFDLLPVFKNTVVGLVWTQLHKRSPINFRPLLAVPKKRNPKGIALVILGLIEDFKRTQNNELINEAKVLGHWLLAEQCCKKTWNNSCWGYHFDWKARAFYVPKGKPNIITTVYVARALFALGAVTQNSEFTDAAIDTAHFIVHHLLVEEDDVSYFAYIPGERAFVHNASLWGAAWVAFIGNETANSRYKALALQVATCSVEQQADNGSWVYGSRGHHQFIDGFHTGYNLEALQLIKKSLATEQFDAVIDKGLAFYQQALFLQDGTAKYYQDNVYPLDMHSVAQAIVTLCKIGSFAKHEQMLANIIATGIKTLYLPKQKRFRYQVNQHWKNNIDYTRWTQAWAYYAFSVYNQCIAETKETQ